MIGTRRLRTGPGGLPVYGYVPTPGLPAVGAVALADEVDAGGVPLASVHAHDFFIVAFFEGDGGALRIGSREWPIAAGEVYLVAPGDVVGVGADIAGLRAAKGRVVSFSPEVLGMAPSRSVLSWRSHPLLFPFAQQTVDEPRRWTIPAADRAHWSARLGAIDREVRHRRHGHREAMAAHLTLLLLDIARLGQPAARAHTPLAAEPVTEEVLAYIDQHYGDPISLKDVARAVHLSPGHLTTVIGRKTGRTVQEWITERRLAEARRLLVETPLAVDEIARQVGYQDPGYLARLFRKAHGTTPLDWRRASRMT